MRHGNKVNALGRKTAHRKALLSNLAVELIRHKRIRTTLAKGKELRKFIEPLVTKSKSDTTHARRVAFSYLKDKEAVTELFTTVSAKVGDRPGGYCRIIKLGTRLGDNAEMCMIELVDFNEMYSNAKPEKKGRKRRSRRSGGKAAEGAAAAAVATEAVEEAVDAAEAVAEETAEAVEEQVEAVAEAVEEKAEEVAEAVEETTEEAVETAEAAAEEAAKVVEEKAEEAAETAEAAAEEASEAADEVKGGDAADDKGEEKKEDEKES